MATSFDSFSPGLEPAPKQMTLSTNYLSFTDGTNDFAQQYLPELYEAEVERYGNRTISGFLRMVGAEMPMTSDQVVWSEQNRLHVSYDTATVATTQTITITIDPGNTAAGVGNKLLAIKPYQTIVVLGAAGEQKCRVRDTAYVYAGGGVGVARTATITVDPYDSAGLLTANGGKFTAADEIAVFVYVSAYEKGSGADYDTNVFSIEPEFTQYDNKPIIIRDKYEINGSDAAQIGWVEVATEDGTSGYLWYLKSESETRLRFEDYMEMAMVEAEKAETGGLTPSNLSADLGSEGLFAAIQDRGQVIAGFAAGAAGAGAVADFDTILEQLDKEGAVEENMLFVNRTVALEIDDMLAKISDGAQGGTSFGLFENDGDMALNLGFSGFRRGSYDFYKTDWKYLNDFATGGIEYDPAGTPGKRNVEGVLIPAGTSTVYDQILGSNIRRPFLHVRYRASQADDRRMKSWVTGSVGGALTSSLDAMQVHFLSERCLCVQGANNFVLFNQA
jgi:hypothetical protein